MNENIIWVGTDDGNIQLTKDGGKQWKNLTKNIKDLPKESWIARIYASRYQEGTAWVIANNYREKGTILPIYLKHQTMEKHGYLL